MLFVTPTAVELSVLTGDCGWDHPIPMRDCQICNIYLAIMNRPASSASTADDITIFTICEIVRMSPLNIGIGLSLERYMCAPARMHDFFKISGICMGGKYHATVAVC